MNKIGDRVLVNDYGQKWPGTIVGVNSERAGVLLDPYSRLVGVSADLIEPEARQMMRLYWNTRCWGWRLWGCGFSTKWFLGLSIRDDG